MYICNVLTTERRGQMAHNQNLNALKANLTFDADFIEVVLFRVTDIS